MTKSADVSTKRLISLAPDNWVKWVTQIPDITAQEILNSEFQWISRESDVLIRAKSPQYGNFLVLNELQLRPTLDMPRRMRAYAALAEEKYKLLTYPVLINILKTTNAEISTTYESNIAGLRAIQDYRVINLWEVDVSIAFEQPLPSLLPFVPILKGGENESTIREALQILRADEQLNQLETVLAFFATFVLDSALVQEIMRWDMAVLRESPWYKEIEQRGVEQGRREELFLSIEMLLEMKFGNEGLELMPIISQVNDLERLKSFQQAIKTANTVEDLREIL
ncbi:Rpn family recombination-promoting nuclease/putative transposase [Nodularia spumigena CS-586/05]|uniref:Rpn family recombination-promoting nuclease/putative transposase n=1 Tax=Nodularia spumigena TaxID=70799 RepID=UPI002330B813|nr:Rpn family recombination-promoting nuclease/putative transposase [Nodularia spumigena]MDB9342621.1 Rpn family recombination-promoting nuclease/putative transposase [Nodularia spumigena CS-588/06]MDB9346843.1 Rpn family recombination-promoting nuclease/putative transposase [Nodularia spumigena CS-588/01]MDB9352822.1 Rpn family recombination-promoting nuclease/putative transposase [Nodularia spumigena CS-588/05]MDB9367974.1 Rpn family recombination-promoting nuclease/putative transposase [Nodu